MKDTIYNIKERILDVAVEKGVTKSVLCKKIGTTYAYFKESAKKDHLNSNVIIDMLYFDIDTNWLLTGEGLMMKKIMLNK